MGIIQTHIRVGINMFEGLSILHTDEAANCIDAFHKAGAARIVCISDDEITVSHDTPRIFDLSEGQVVVLREGFKADLDDFEV